MRFLEDFHVKIVYDDRLAHPELKLDIDTEEDYQRFSQMKVDIEMEAHEIVAAARGLGKHETP